ncbi:hypothetical protein MPLSOD_410017 [Mesorhizobium sp. SOD10]|nr:hypothetical protein MPLSOD_410017 [Mesorhizobium sp. SOD10]
MRGRYDAHSALRGRAGAFDTGREMVWLKACVKSVAKRRGAQKTIVALAPRLPVIMHRICF